MVKEEDLGKKDDIYQILHILIYRQKIKIFFLSNLNTCVDNAKRSASAAIFLCNQEFKLDDE